MHIKGNMCSIEKILTDARLLVNRLREHDTAADSLIAQAQALNKRVDGMKQYQEDMNDLNEVARHRPRSTLILGLAQENRQIRELQQENRELRISLDEYQTALELIMSKYREQVLKLVMARKVDNNVDRAVNSAQNGKQLQEKIDKICEMAAVMQESIKIDDLAIPKEEELVKRLKIENEGLREMLRIRNSLNPPQLCDHECQTNLDDSMELSNSQEGMS
ncbi:FGFR1 oncogene partner 2 homolog [Lingula anatina]|uniref:FGFR1 oncogene partner 2 homolog n=1 Tax=Lingula anatina TaxID=7574 RepID=A0A1S3KDZ7_LINAN|nr:FGFR1 oncogene partner 2 homolog [Lingula anatina]|eukprot:XP_013420722.1 FGFR1 oncogene partner 2 homolog [Lingula anatina]